MCTAYGTLFIAVVVKGNFQTSNVIPVTKFQGNTRVYYSVNGTHRPLTSVLRG